MAPASPADSPEMPSLSKFSTPLDWLQMPIEPFVMGAAIRAGGREFCNSSDSSASGSLYSASYEAPLFVSSPFFSSDSRPTSIESWDDLQEPPRQSISVKELAEVRAKAKKQQAPGYIMEPWMVTTVEEAEGMALPSLLGAGLQSYTPGELLVKNSSFQAQQGPMSHMTGGKMNAWLNACEEEADREASLHCLPECLASDILDEKKSAEHGRSGQEDLSMDSANWMNSQAPFYFQDMPSIGSNSHNVGLCKPCAFASTKGCKDGAGCKFCHLCAPGEKKRRKKQKRAYISGLQKNMIRGIA
jgi:hypothetical protein